MSAPDYKTIILSRYSGEFPPAGEHEQHVITKSSNDIVMDLRPMADFSTNEIAEYMIGAGYRIDFEEGNPVWVMQAPPLQLNE